MICVDVMSKGFLILRFPDDVGHPKHLPTLAITVLLRPDAPGAVLLCREWAGIHKSKFREMKFCTVSAEASTDLEPHLPQYAEMCSRRSGCFAGDIPSMRFNLRIA